jgi:hypothetical protein
MLCGAERQYNPDAAAVAAEVSAFRFKLLWLDSTVEPFVLLMMSERGIFSAAVVEQYPSCLQAVQTSSSSSKASLMLTGDIDEGVSLQVELSHTSTCGNLLCKWISVPSLHNGQSWGPICSAACLSWWARAMSVRQQAALCNVQPLRDSLQQLTRLGGADVCASIMLPLASDRPGPLEAGHRRARSLILTPTECKKAARTSCRAPAKKPLPAAGGNGHPTTAPCPGNEATDLMLFTPETACVKRESFFIDIMRRMWCNQPLKRQ